MKKIFMLLVAIAAMVFVSCSKDDDDENLLNNEEGVVTMVTQAKEILNTGYNDDFCVYSFDEGDIITIDWGDGKQEEFKTVVEDGSDEFYEYWTDLLAHSYLSEGPHTITIKGKIKEVACVRSSDLTSIDVSKCPALTGLFCWGNDISFLDISKNTALTRLWCDNNNLTSLDVSKNTALQEIECQGNELTSTALNKIFTDLPKGKLIENSDYDQSFIRVMNNPGSETCNKSIAENKGWIVVNY